MKPPTTSPPRPPTIAPAPAATRPASSTRIQMSTEAPPPRGLRVVLNAVEGWGKTSCAAFATSPAILMAEGETGYETLLQHGRAPNVPRDKIANWESLLTYLHELASGCPFDLLALDALGGIERLCHALVCEREFKNEWGEKGFSGFRRGFDVAVSEWLKMLQALDAIADGGTHILLLGHVLVRSFKNPLGPDYDRFTGDTDPKTTAAATGRWADAVLFGTFRTIVDTGALGGKPKRGKGIGGQDRVLYTQHHDAYDAKNRLGMPPEIEIANDPAALWSTIIGAIGTHPVSNEEKSDATS